jgi:hypothetical protein
MAGTEGKCRGSGVWSMVRQKSIFAFGHSSASVKSRPACGPLPSSPDARPSLSGVSPKELWRRRVTNTTFALGGARVGVLQTARQGGIRDVHLHVAC